MDIFISNIKQNTDIIKLIYAFLPSIYNQQIYKLRTNIIKYNCLVKKCNLQDDCIRGAITIPIKYIYCNWEFLFVSDVEDEICGCKKIPYEIYLYNNHNEGYDHINPCYICTKCKKENIIRTYNINFDCVITFDTYADCISFKIY